MAATNEALWKLPGDLHCALFDDAVENPLEYGTSVAGDA